MYRPFFTQWHYFQDFWNEERYQMPRIFPVSARETNNISIIVKSSGDWPFFALASNRQNDYQPQGGSQCFPFYTYSEDATHRQENITDWALDQYGTITNRNPSPSGTSSTQPTPSSTTRSTAPATPPTSSANCTASRIRDAVLGGNVAQDRAALVRTKEERDLQNLRSRTH
jgi:hypothetical protein